MAAGKRIAKFNRERIAKFKEDRRILEEDRIKLNRTQSEFEEKRKELEEDRRILEEDIIKLNRTQSEFEELQKQESHSHQPISGSLKDKKSPEWIWIAGSVALIAALAVGGRYFESQFKDVKQGSKPQSLKVQIKKKKTMIFLNPIINNGYKNN